MTTTADAPSTTSTEQLDEQIRAAHTAYEQAHDVTPRRRAEWLEAIASALEEHAEELVPLAQKETHLATGRLQGELKRTVFQLRLFADEIVRGEHFDATIDHEDAAWGMGPRPDIRRLKVPLGVVGVFGASNFPFAFSVIGGDSASALAAGCAVVHKIHDGHRDLAVRTGQIVAEALRAADAPTGLFSTVTGRAAAQGLVDHPLVQAIGFTGSPSGGRALFDRACRRPVPIPFYGELGSINPVFVTEKAWATRRDEILAGYANASTLGMGQFCTKPGLLFVPASDIDEVTDVLRRELGTKPRTALLTPHLREGFDAALASVRALPTVDELIAGDDAEAPHPTVLITSSEDVRNDATVLEQEIFGPATVIVQYRSEGELEELASLLGGQLTATIQAEADERLTGLVSALRGTSGRVLWNSWPTGVTVSYAQHHGGPYPATTAPATTSVGTASIGRFMRPVAYQSFPESQLPPALREANPWAIARRVDGRREPASA
ncbi:aldehyde dehydrogenase (NADP(+)) [Streptomyces botrytidirepellens]|uniref:Aldehyde dehydrogenase (NADP(+)) n=1 Tax=Streptomyces botrytidirepellens TaxID=2486417 RepID=A0A3M8X7H7_9ACTN|nr:aldehyde dehydrogenase (NADP(+)) [Streptomyces botrytidirepellens]RNG38342.1 aldehyde dehydrogenase (NADP(+)) [Streptomyces botrytidirepellens]